MARSDHEGLSVWYRIGWRVRYALTSVFGPAQLSASEDPQSQLIRERAERVVARREARSKAEAGGR